MKTKMLFLFIAVFSFGVFAQEKVDCIEKEKQFNQMLFERAFDKANQEWSSIKKSCGTSSEHFCRLGVELLQYNIDVAAAADKEKTVRTLLEWYDQYDKSFPENNNGNLVHKAMALSDNKVGSESEIYSYLDAAFQLKKESFTDALALSIYFDLYYKKYTASKSTITINQLLEKYFAVNALLEASATKVPEKKQNCLTAMAGMKSLMLDLLVCDNLVPYTQDNFEQNKSNVDWLSSVASLMSERCYAKPVVEKICLQLHLLQPTSKSAAYLGKYYTNILNQPKAVEYYQLSATLATTVQEKSSILYTLASVLVSTDKAKSREVILSAIAVDPKNSKYLIFLANLYANATECAANDKEKKAIYKLAINTLQKALLLDSKYKSAIDNLLKNCTKNMGDASELKNKSVKIGCWINETVQF